MLSADTLSVILKLLSIQYSDIKYYQNISHVFLTCAPFSVQILSQWVIHFLKQLKNKTTYSVFDDMPIFAIENLLEVLKHPICYVANLSMRTGKFSKSLKDGTIIPLHNYRPITNFWSISTILDKALAFYILFVPVCEHDKLLQLLLNPRFL